MDEEEQQINSTPLEQVEAEEIKKVFSSMKEFYAIWSDWGLETEQKTQRAKFVWSYIHTLLKDILSEENAYYGEIRERIQKYSVKISELSEVLSITPKEIHGSIVQKEFMLREELEALVMLKNTRVKVYEDLKRQEEKYCEIMGYKKRDLSFKDGVLSEDGLYEIGQHVNMLKEELDRRHKKFCSLKNELTTILEMTELLPETSLERDVLSGKDIFPLSNDTFKALEDTISRAQGKRAELEVRKTKLINRLTALWQRLKVKERERVEFLAIYVDCRLSTLRSIELEIERCEQVQNENIKIVVDSLRQELEVLWSQCHASEEQRKLFSFYFSSEMSNQILEAHDAEVFRWKIYYDKVKHILDKIDKRQKLFDLMVMFEIKEADPKRYQNRKGNLLKEEKERKRIQRELPALETELMKDIDDYEGDNGVPFLYDGGDYREFVKNQWAERIIQKENDKLKRQKQHLLLLLDEANTPCKKPLTEMPKSAPSRLLKSSDTLSTFRTPAKAISKVLPNTAVKLPYTLSKLNTSSASVAENKVISLNVSKRCKINGFRSNTIQMRYRQILREKKRVLKDESHNSTTYTEFAKALNKTNRCSTVLVTKKPGGGGTRTSQNISHRKSIGKSHLKSLRK